MLSYITLLFGGDFKIKANQEIQTKKNINKTQEKTEKQVSFK